MIVFILNTPYTIIGLVMSLISIPTKIEFKKNPHVFVFSVKKFWWAFFGYMKYARAMTFGNVIIMGPNIENKDLEHEFIHIEQFQRSPFIFPILYYIELIKKGYRNSKYEDEAYRRAGNIYKRKI